MFLMFALCINCNFYFTYKQVCADSVHLLSLEDFKSMSIAIADARLLVERFRVEKSQRELASIVASVRSKPKKASDKTTVDLVWQHYDSKKKDFKTITIRHGGGNRRTSFPKDSKLQEIFDYVKLLYFPGGTSSQGILAGLFCSLHGPDYLVINDLTMTLIEFAKLKALKTLKFVLRSRKWNVGIHPYVMSDDSDLDDFVLKPKSHSTPTPTISNARQGRRRALVPDEPSLMENSSVIFVTHPNLGQIQRLFLATSKMADVYNWVGSLTQDPDLFDLCTGIPGSYVPINPNENISKFENRLLAVVGKLNSDLTIDIISGSNISMGTRSSATTNPTATAATPATSNSTVTTNFVPAAKTTAKTVRCPICSDFFSIEDIEQHSSDCADSKFLNIIDSDSSLEEYMNRRETEDHDEPKENVTLSLSDVLSINNQNEAIKLRVRRGRCFADFVQKFKLSWVKKRGDCFISVHFIGEQGVDQGGLSREFFTGKFIFSFNVVNIKSEFKNFRWC